MGLSEIRDREATLKLGEVRGGGGGGGGLTSDPKWAEEEGG